MGSASLRWWAAVMGIRGSAKSSKRSKWWPILRSATRKTLRERPSYCEKARENLRRLSCSCVSGSPGAASWLGEFPEALARFDVAQGPSRDLFLLIGRKLSDDLCGGAEDQRTWRHGHS